MLDLGQSSNPPLHLAHANGFPPGSYRLLAETLADDYRIIALPSYPQAPGTQPEQVTSWRPLATDLIHALQELQIQSVVAIGHSLGGVLSLWAAIDRPDLVRAAVLIDPVVLLPHWLWTLRLLRLFGLGRHQPLVQGALRRRRAWPDRRACFDHMRHRSLFARWPDAALWDYVNSGTVEQADGQVVLSYPPEWEARIFATVPLNIWDDVPQLRLPCLVIRGQYSGTFRPRALARVACLLPQAQCITIADAGHLVPMEKPQETGAAIRRFLTACVKA